MLSSTIPVFWAAACLLQPIRSSFLDLDELKTSLYTVEISDIPIAKPKEGDFDLGSDQGTIQVSSKVGQKYLCHYKLTPTRPDEATQEKPADINITDLLEPMRGNCLFKTKDWWSYEFCYGSEITQYHDDNGRKVGQVMSLGKYESDQKWTEEDLENLKKSTINRYHTQQYSEGSVCDLTNKPRKTEVRFSCLEGEADHIGAIAELESCSYILFVYTSKICHHPYLRPPIQATPSPIECQPVVSQATYDNYIKAAEEASIKMHAEQEAAAARQEGTTPLSEKDLGKGIDDLDLENLDEDDMERLQNSIKEQFSDMMNTQDLDLQFMDVNSVAAQMAELIKDFKPQKGTAGADTENTEGGAESEENKKDIRRPDDEEYNSLPATVKRQEEKLLSNMYAMIREVAAQYPKIAGNTDAIRREITLKLNQIIERTHQEIRSNNEGVALSSKHLQRKIMLRALDEKLMKMEREEAAGTESTAAKSPTGQLKAQEERLMKMISELTKDMGTVSKYKETIRSYISTQFDDIIEEARQELEASGEEVGDALGDLEELKRSMSGVLDTKLAELEALERKSEGLTDAKTTKEPFEALKKALDGVKNPKGKSQDKKKSEIKVEFLQPNQQLEVEMIDLDTLDENSEFFQFKKEAREKQQKAGGEQATDIPTMLAVLKPMRVKGTRYEEKKHGKLQQNYGKSWDSSGTDHDEL